MADLSMPIVPKYSDPEPAAIIARVMGQTPGADVVAVDHIRLYAKLYTRLERERIVKWLQSLGDVPARQAAIMLSHQVEP